MSPGQSAALIEAGLQVSPPCILGSCNVADSLEKCVIPALLFIHPSV